MTAGNNVNSVFLNAVILFVLYFACDKRVKAGVRSLHPVLSCTAGNNAYSPDFFFSERKYARRLLSRKKRAGSKFLHRNRSNKFALYAYLHSAPFTERSAVF